MHAYKRRLRVKRLAASSEDVEDEDAEGSAGVDDDPERDPLRPEVPPEVPPEVSASARPDPEDPAVLSLPSAQSKSVNPS